MKLRESTKLHRKSGIWGTRHLLEGESEGVGFDRRKRRQGSLPALGPYQTRQRSAFAIG
jgi:hypothetical protein